MKGGSCPLFTLSVDPDFRLVLNLSIKLPKQTHKNGSIWCGHPFLKLDFSFFSEFLWIWRTGVHPAGDLNRQELSRWKWAAPAALMNNKETRLHLIPPPPRAVKLLWRKARLSSTHISPELLLRRWFPQPALEDDFPAAHVRPESAPRWEGRGLSAGGHQLRGLGCSSRGCSALPAEVWAPHLGTGGSEVGGEEEQVVSPGSGTLWTGLLSESNSTRGRRAANWCGLRLPLSPGVRSLFSQLRPRPPRAQHRDGPLQWTAR